MKKNIFYWAFLVLAGMGLTACSSGDDNIADNTTPVTPDSQNKTVILTGTIGVGGDETRAVDKDGKTSWTVGDDIAIIYESTSSTYSTVQGEIKSVSSDGHYATFEAALTNPKDDGKIGFAYPFANVNVKATPDNAYDFKFDYTAYRTQKGTTATITSSGLDYACTEEGGEVKMAVDGSTAKLKGTALLKNQFSMFEFTLKTDEATPQNALATKLKIWVGSENFSSTPTYTIEPDNSDAYSTFYVALEPTESTVDKVKIVASFDGKDAAIKLDTDAKVNEIDDDDYGKFLCVDETVNKNTSKKDHQAYLCATTGSAYFCEHTYTTSKFVKGKLYTKKLEVKKLTPTAVIAYVGGVDNYWSKFLALGLYDVTTNPINATSALDSETEAAVTAWMNTNKMKIAEASYDDMYASNYDEVPESPQVGTENNHYASEFISSKTRNTDGDKGWRVPSVTDFRYIIQSVTEGRVSATTPIGVMDFNGIYELNSTNPHIITQSGYGRGETIAANINTLCDNSNFDTHFYWTSSKLSGNSEKGWRFDFDHNYFIWNQASSAASDMAKVRPVFAY